MKRMQRLCVAVATSWVAALIGATIPEDHFTAANGEKGDAQISLPKANRWRRSFSCERLAAGGRRGRHSACAANDFPSGDGSGSRGTSNALDAGDDASEDNAAMYAATVQALSYERQALEDLFFGGSGGKTSGNTAVLPEDDPLRVVFRTLLARAAEWVLALRPATTYTIELPQGHGSYEVDFAQCEKELLKQPQSINEIRAQVCERQTSSKDDWKNTVHLLSLAALGSYSVWPPEEVAKAFMSQCFVSTNEVLRRVQQLLCAALDELTGGTGYEDDFVKLTDSASTPEVRLKSAKDLVKRVKAAALQMKTLCGSVAQADDGADAELWANFMSLLNAEKALRRIAAQPTAAEDVQGAAGSTRLAERQSRPLSRSRGSQQNL